MVSVDPFREGDVLAGKYRLQGLLGKGGMGVVYSATHLGLEQRVAVKLLRPDHCQNPEAVRRFLAEARATARLRGAHVAKVLDVDSLDSNLPFFVMEFLEGVNLQQLLAQQGPLPVPEAVDLVLEACEAVAEAHRAGIVHRDLKPANLFLARNAYGEPTIKVLDFGISKLLEPSEVGVGITDSRTMVGSPVYMSPEQMRSARDVDPRTDIWSLGTVLFELLTGTPVWVGENLADLCAQIARDPTPQLVAVLPQVPPELSTIVTRCLQKDPAQRYQQTSDLALALVQFASKRGQLAVAHMLALLGLSVQPSVETKRGPAWNADTPSTPQDSTIRGTAATGATRSASRRWGRMTRVRSVLLAATAAGVASWLYYTGITHDRASELAANRPAPSQLPTPTEGSTTTPSGSASRALLERLAATDPAATVDASMATPASRIATNDSTRDPRNASSVAPVTTASATTAATLTSSVAVRRHHTVSLLSRPPHTVEPNPAASSVSVDPMSIRK